VRPSSEKLLEMMSDKTDEELYDILHVHPEDYTSETIEAARRAFDDRQLGAPRLGSVAAAVEKVREKEDAHLSWPLRMLAFFVSTAIFFIPVLLAHRHFVEKGEKCKAREWARWAFYGFLFYCLLGVLLRALTSTGY
jgi:hypothetical protein